MSKTRDSAFMAVGAAFLPLERSAHDAAAAAGRCVATMIEQRQRVQLGPDFAAKSIELTSQATNRLVEAANLLAEAHRIFAEDSKDVRFGPYCPVSRALRSVEAAA